MSGKQFLDTDMRKCFPGRLPLLMLVSSWSQRIPRPHVSRTTDFPHVRIHFTSWWTLPMDFSPFIYLFIYSLYILMDVFPPSSPLCSTQHLPHLPSFLLKEGEGPPWVPTQAGTWNPARLSTASPTLSFSVWQVACFPLPASGQSRHCLLPEENRCTSRSKVPFLSGTSRLL